MSFLDMKADAFKPTAKFMRTLLWAALLHDDPNLTEEQVGAMVGLHNARLVMEKITKTWALAMKGEGEGEGEQSSSPQ